MKRVAFLLGVLAPGFAQADMSASEFEAYVAGRTLTYADRGVIYGIEQYMPNRRVRWAFIGDECHEGYWYEANGGEICFVYENNPEAPQCWRFTETGEGLSARFMGGNDGPVHYEAEQSKEPMTCLGPKIGV